MTSISEAPMEMKNRNEPSSIKTVIANNLSEEIIGRERVTADEGNNRDMKNLSLFYFLGNCSSCFSSLFAHYNLITHCVL